MENSNIIFDTNAYRKFVYSKSEELTKNKISRLINLEKSRNIKAFISPIVAMEMYCYLNDLSNPDYNLYKNAVIAQYQHSLEGNNPRQIGFFDIDVCTILFGQYPKSSFEFHDKALRMSQYLYKNSSLTNLEHYTKNFSAIRNFVLDREKSYLNRLLKFNNDHFIQSQEEQLKIKKELTTNISISKISIKIVKEAQKLLSPLFDNLSQDILKEKQLLIEQQFLPAIICYRNIIKSIVVNSNGNYNFNDMKKANNYWDYQISFHIGNNIASKNVFLVTDDTKSFPHAAKEAGFGDRVIKLDNYLDFIGFNK